MDLASDQGIQPRGRLDPKQLPNVRSLGKGSSGFIYETTWFGRGRYARKDFPLRSLKRSRIFEKEANALLELDHQNLVRCFGYTLGKSSSSLLQEYVDDDLQNIVQRKIEAQRVSSSFHSRVVDDVEEIKRLLSSRDKGTTGLDDGNTLQFEMREAENIISQIAAGMKYLHDKEIAHGDLKPKNVLLYLDKTKAVKLADYGLQGTKKLIKLVSKRSRHFEILTWKAPECLEELLGPVADDPFTDSDIDSDEDIERYDKFLESRLAKADVYSFGLTCSYILGARLVFPMLRLTQLREQRMHDLERISVFLPPTCPEHLRSLIVSCLQSNPLSRPTFSDICDTLKEDGGARGSANTNLDGVEMTAGSPSDGSASDGFASDLYSGEMEATGVTKLHIHKGEVEPGPASDPSFPMGVGSIRLGKRKWNDEGTSLGADANPDRSCFPTLLPKHKIFLSHSGKQKWFVEKLCEDLEACHRFPFFDKRPSSLPKDERFPKLILEAAEQCEVVVVVVSEEYLTSKWPMIELNTFVQALFGSNRGLRILPLFFGLSVSDLRSPSREGEWLKVWDEWARDDGRIKPMEFKGALEVVLKGAWKVMLKGASEAMRSFNSIEFNGNMDNLWRYQKEVVRSICSVVAVDVKWEDSHIQGRSTICEATREKIKVIKPSEKYGVCVFGYYGVGGIGKTTMCKTLCNELSEFLGKVCHIELGGTRSVEEMLKKVLRKLTSSSEELLQRLDEDECWSILRNPSFWRQKMFLAIDNVWEDNKSMEQAQMLLDELAFCDGSVVMVTSRCESTLMGLGIRRAHCFEVPELERVDAKNLFLHHVARGKQFDSDEDIRIIKQCLACCRFWNNETWGYHYLPLALKELGMHLRRLGDSPAKWLEALPTVRDFHFLEDNPVVDIIKLNYDQLSSDGSASDLYSGKMEAAGFTKFHIHKREVKSGSASDSSFPMSVGSKRLGKREWYDEGTSLGADANPDRSCFPTLLPKHKIFLSHSGKQKWFVEKLCEDLEACHRFPFFDKRPSSLPKGERFPKLILEAAEQCEVVVVVVSEEYLTSKWPMIELNTFVQALSGSNPKLKILPLFFGLSVSDLRSPSRELAWLTVWDEWARDDGRMKPVEFEWALKVMHSYNGIEFNGNMDNLWSYEKEVVRSICSVVAASVKWEELFLEIIKRISYPHIIYSFGAHHCGPQISSAYFMEYLSFDLYSFIVDRVRLGDNQPPFSPHESVDVLLQIAEAMRCMHDETLNVVHCDLKSSNILLSNIATSENASHYLVKVAEFGSARLADSSSGFIPGAFTTSYAAPEVLRRRSDKTVCINSPRKIDVFSFGIVAFEVLTGKDNHELFSRSPSWFKKGVIDGTVRPPLRDECQQHKEYTQDKYLISLIEMCWHDNPSKRPSFVEICEELHRARVRILEHILQKDDPNPRRTNWGWPSFRGTRAYLRKIASSSRNSSR